MFEELGVDYVVHEVNIRRGEQKAPEVLSRNPYGKVPIVAWTEADGQRTLFESGAILLDFARRHRRLLPGCGRARDEVMSWLMVALTGLGPMMGQAHHWTALAPERPEAARAHSVALVRRVYAVMDKRLSAVPYLGDEYSIADIAAFPWVTRSEWVTVDIREYPNLSRWHDLVANRPGVAAGMAKPEGAVLEG
jgi:GST-like protein